MTTTIYEGYCSKDGAFSSKTPYCPDCGGDWQNEKAIGREVAMSACEEASWHAAQKFGLLTKVRKPSAKGRPKT